MEKDEKGFLKKIEADLVKWLTGSFLTAIGIGVAFYFNTTNTMQAHSEKIDKLDFKVSAIEEKVNQIVITPAINTEQIKNIQQDMQEIKRQLNKQDERTEKILDMVNYLYQKK
jgi:septal ring factor EnvC (AmiA/AmiB activator)